MTISAEQIPAQTQERQPALESEMSALSLSYIRLVIFSRRSLFNDSNPANFLT
jgi:hypothetical protein